MLYQVKKVPIKHLLHLGKLSAKYVKGDLSVGSHLVVFGNYFEIVL
jgi:hypothetical protein